MSASGADAPPVPKESHSPHHRMHVLSLAGEPGATVLLPLAFSYPVRRDLIRKAVDVAQSHRRQPYGTSPTAGTRHSVQWSGKGRGVSRTPRLMDSMRGAQAPNTVGGRPAHPPKVERIWAKSINTKERRRAFASALAATRVVPLARGRGHELPQERPLPVIVEDPVENIQSTEAARKFLETLELWADVERADLHTHMRAGRGKRRNRRWHTPRSLLVVTSAPGRARGFRNLPGVDVVTAQRLATEDLAPGGEPGRLTLFSRAAVESLRARLNEEAP